MTTTKHYYNIQRYNNATAKLEPLQLRTIGYRNDRRTGNYIAVYTNPALPKTSKYARQEIVVLPHIFARVVPAAVKSDVIAGCIEVTPAQFAELGFVTHDVREVITDDARLSLC